MVNRKRAYTLHFLLLAVLCTAALALVNFLAIQTRSRLDLTADKRFTLSEGTQRLFDTLTDPVHVTYVVDEELPPKRINLERDVRDKLQELAETSGGKLTWSVEKVTNADAANKLEELQKRHIEKIVDVLTSGTDETAQFKGYQGYFSSLEIKYGLSEPVVINGVRNLVDTFDESSDHRVDTMEFDICFSILQMRSKAGRAPPRLLVKALKEPLTLTLFNSAQMPITNPKLAETIFAALKELEREGGEKVKVQREHSAWGRDRIQLMPYAVASETLETVDPDDMTRKGPKYYYAIVHMAVEGRQPALVADFRDENTAEKVLAKLEKQLGELLAPRAKLGFVLPPAASPDQPGMPPGRTPYTDAFNYIRNTFGYETVLVDLNAERRIPRDLAVLVVIEPNRISERELYEVDRYLAEGGNVVLLFQGWQASLALPGRRRPENLALDKVATNKFFENWARHIGVEFGQDMLLDKSGQGRLRPYRRLPNGASEPFPITVPLAACIEPGDINPDSVYGRRLAGMPLPFAVEIKVDDKVLEEAKLERQDVITLKEDVYRLIPANPAFPEIPLRLDLNAPAEVESDAAVTPDKEIRAQKLDHGALVAARLRGAFPSFWNSDAKTVPAWTAPPADGDSAAGKRAPPLTGRPGTLLVCSSAATLHIEYLYGYDYDEVMKVVIPTGCTFFRNMAEAFIYGDDLVSLRVRTGVAPRISGEVTEGRRIWWLLLCIAGAPLLILVAGVGRGLLKARAREQYQAAIGAAGQG